jgi:hypothetical protein
MKTERIKGIIYFLILSMFTGCCLSFPESIREFLGATMFAMLFWIGFFIESILENK